MKILMPVVSLLFVVSLYSQNNKTIQLLNKIDSTAIASANVFVDDQFVSNSDDQGFFSVPASREFSAVKISHVLFGSVVFTKAAILKTEKIYLEEKTSQLDAVNISGHKKIEKLIFPEKSTLNLKKNGVSFPYNTEVAVFVPNDRLLDSYYISKIIIKTAKNQFIKSNDAKYIPFEVNLYSVDPVSGLPGTKVFNDNFFAVRKQDDADVSIDLSAMPWTAFPDNGIFIVVGLFNEAYYVGMGYSQKPSFGVVRRKKKSNFKEYHRNLVDGEPGEWTEPMYSKFNLQCFNFGLQITK
ncbi:MAG: hypothetical protein CFE23_15210 [Flavobacterium sp. BFFFF1]|uniref:hypothetical protein n=1 Tax=Flavobacterium sp. BFFFF1 TaxID=2015557 RepID=UPI000BD35951|nr:hypothetical protein [Flavobacterium sp. BFFFF1]OYU79184.1 MAG: hypothetical protein CFE23_15210 [Flavobacterium sp. BFFFF1]